MPGQFRLATRVSLLALGSALLLTHSAGAQQKEPYPGFDAFVTKAMADAKVPGAAVAIVRNDSVIYTKGYGVRELGKPATVDDHTLFEIGSATKTFTSTLVGILQTEGKMRFDDKISRHLPDFRMFDAYANAEVTIRDALSHRTGISRGELAWLGTGASRAEILRRIRFQEPATSFRSAFAYNNPMFLAAGEAAGRAGNGTWEGLIQERIFNQLGMSESKPLVMDFAPYANSAMPHANGPSGPYAQEHMPLDNIAPAGSIVSNAQDMAKWLRFQMGDGSFNGKRVIATAILRETHTPQMVVSGGGGGGGAARGGDGIARLNAYGLGWFINDYKSNVYWNHGGNTDGMTTAQGILPTEKIGVVVLSNLDHTSLPEVVVRYVFDRHLKIPLESNAQPQRAAGGGGGGGGARQAPAPAPSTPPLPLEAYVGTFADSLFGEATVTVQNGKLFTVRGEISGPMEHVTRDNFSWNTNVSVLPPIPVQFHIGLDGRVTALSLGIQGDIRRFGKKNPSGSRGPGGGE